MPNFLISTKEDCSKLEYLYCTKKLTLSEISKIFNTTRDTISSTVLRLGLIRPDLRTFSRPKQSLDRTIIQKGNLKKLVELYFSHTSEKELAKIFNCSTTTIRSTIKRSGYELLPKTKGWNKKLTKVQEETLLNLYVDKKFTIKNLAEIFNCTQVTVLNYLKKLGVDVERRYEEKGPKEVTILPKSTHNLLKKLYLFERKFIPELMKIFGCSRLLIFNTLKYLDCLQDYWSEEYLQEYKLLYLDLRQSFGKIGKTYRISPERLAKVFKERGWFKRKSDWLRNKRHEIPENKISKREFDRHVTRVTRMIYKRYAKVIPKEKGITASTGHLDHIYSKYDVYYNPKKLKTCVKIQEVCHPCNLQLISTAKNQAKSFRSHIKISSLRKEIRKFNALYGNPFKSAPFLKFNFSQLNTSY